MSLVRFTNGLQNRKHLRFLPEHFNAEIFGKLKSWHLGGLHLCHSHSLSLSHPCTKPHAVSLSHFLSIPSSLLLTLSLSFSLSHSRSWPSALLNDLFLLTRSAFSKLSQANFNLERLLLMTTSNFLISKSLKCFRLLISGFIRYCGKGNEDLGKRKNSVGLDS